jgi:L-alanine-DL-glutamate epimerase-like enolase superfamily enzyme
MELSYEPITVDLEIPFRIAHGTSVSRHNVLVRLEDGEYEGWGEAAPVRQHNETQKGVMAYLDSVRGILGETPDPFLLEDLLASLPPGSQAAKAALDIALHDLIGKRLDMPLYKLLGLNPDRTPQTSYTIGIASLDEVRTRAAAASAQFSILKLKFGADTEHNLAMIRAVREVSQARLVADANCAWTVSQCAEIIPRLADLGLEWIEQPLPEEQVREMGQVRDASPLPIFADEPVRTAQNIARLAPYVDGVNIKVMKAGGLREALRMVAVARAHGLQVMLGCMIETSLGITAAAHLSPLVDWADLDGNQTVTNDPFVGAGVVSGCLALPNGPGVGVHLRN